VAALWLEDVAHQTVATALVLSVAQVEAPEDRDLSWVGRHRLEERPDKHHEEDVKHSQHHCNQVVVYTAQPLEITYELGTEDYSHVGVVDSTHDKEHKEYEEIANNLGRADGKPSRHF